MHIGYQCCTGCKHNRRSLPLSTALLPGRATGILPEAAGWLLSIYFVSYLFSCLFLCLNLVIVSFFAMQEVDGVFQLVVYVLAGKLFHIQWYRDVRCYPFAFQYFAFGCT